jgi:hypothetical protein
MKKIIVTAFFVLASFSSFANSNAISNSSIVPVKDKIEVVNISNTNLIEDKQKEIVCTYTISLGFVSFSYSWDC